MIQLCTHAILGGLKPFVFTIDTTITYVGSSNNNQIVIPIRAQVLATFDFKVDFGDGTVNEYNSSGDITYTYAVPGIYTIKISGILSTINYNTTGDKDKVINLSQFGDLQFYSLVGAFRACNNMQATYTDKPKFYSANPSLSQSFAGTLLTNSNSVDFIPSTVSSLFGTFQAVSGKNFSELATNLSLLNCTDISFLFSQSGANANFGQWQLGSVLTTAANIFASSSMSTANYTDTIVGWANYVYTTGFPLNVNMANQTGRTFDTSRSGGVGFANAGAARSYLTKNVTAATFGDANVNGVYTINFSTNIYTNTNGYYFQWNGASWTLFDNLSVSIEVGTGGLSTSTPASSTWVGGSVTNSNAGWTISGDTVI